MSLLQLAAGASTEIKVDQVGYLPQARKYAMVVHADHSVADKNFVIRRAADKSVAFSGKLSEAVLDPDT
ncbi:MAG: hypothetical protein JO217_04215, partial [Acidobacteriaceae bacterium]|nr:hypothetical protein [Acidobacteriaceae bacterium]